jgi:hypothetical protein
MRDQVLGRPALLEVTRLIDLVHGQRVHEEVELLPDAFLIRHQRRHRPILGHGDSMAAPRDRDRSPDDGARILSAEEGRSRVSIRQGSNAG